MTKMDWEKARAKRRAAPLQAPGIPSAGYVMRERLREIWWINGKAQGTRAFVARSDNSYASTVLIGPFDGKWKRAVSYNDGAHRKRAERFVSAYNEARANRTHGKEKN